MIAADLETRQINLTQPPADDKPFLQYWCLNDDIRNPDSIIGRKDFRERVAQVQDSGKPRAMVVTGSPGTGVRYSIRLLRRTLGPQVPIIVFSPKDLQRLAPVEFLRSCLKELDIISTAEAPQPSAVENLSRWLRVDLPLWFANQLQASTEAARYKFPIWIVINAVTKGNDERLPWADGLRDLLASLGGAHDEGQPAIDVPQIRWLYLARRLEVLPVAGIERLSEVTTDARYDSDFAECMQLAWFAIDKGAGEIPTEMTETMAHLAVEGARRTPVRQVLANLVRDCILKRLAKSEG